MDFSGRYWDELPFPSQEGFLTQGPNPWLLHLQVDSLALSHLGSKVAGEENGSPLQYSCLGKPMDSMKRLKDRMLEDEPPTGQKMSSMLLGKSGGQLLIAPERMKQLGQSRSDIQLQMCLVVKAKSDAVKNNIA